jgi:AcrR family transcriptional regulator
VAVNLRQPTTRRRNAATTRQSILQAAHRRFLDQSYDTVGLREIASDAGVDVALISRYFGGKEQLFKEVLREGKSALPSDLTPSELPAYLAQLATEQHFDAEANCYESLLMILRSASSPQASAVVRNALKEDILGPLSSVLGDGEEASTAASLATAIWMGTAILRVVAPVQAICPCDVQLRQRLEALFAAALKQPAV